MDKIHTRHSFMIAVGITLTILMMVGSSVAITEIDSCTTISEPGDYVLNQSIINSVASNCIEITSNDVVFDGAGYTIDGIDASNSNGIYVFNINTLTNISVINTKVTDWHNGIHYRGTINGNITNNNASSNDNGIYISQSGSLVLNSSNASSNNNGIYLESSSGNILAKNIVNSNGNYGIYFSTSSGNILTNNNASSNTNGIGIVYSGSNILISNIANSNNYYNSNNYGIYFYDSSSNNLTNNTASSNKIGIYFYASSSNNILTNNTANSNNYGIYFEITSNNNTLISNIANSNNIGIYFSNSGSNNLINNTAILNSNNGIYFSSSGGNTLNGNTANVNSYGINFYNSGSNNLSKNTVNLNGNSGIIFTDSASNTVTSNTLKLNNINGIYLIRSGSNTFYNNYFMNINNLAVIETNILNITKQTDTNIIGGSYIGGNFWALPSGMGFSQTCVDEDGDGICNDPYVLNANNIDYLPLSMNFTSDNTPPVSVTNLKNITYASNYINWTWTDPSNDDFDKLMVYMNGDFKNDVLKGVQYYNATGLTPATSYEISIRTVDIAGNINGTWVNLTAVTAPTVSGPRTITVNASGGAMYTKIQDAIDNAIVGDTIEVYSGTYSENVNVNKQVILIGMNMSDGKPLVDAGKNGNAITLSANGITLNGFTTINASYPNAGIRVNSNDNILIGNNASSNNNGIHLENSVNNNITGNIASNNDVSGIRLRLSNSNAILNNSITSNSNNGIYIISSNSNIVSENNVSYNYYGIALTNSSINTILNNTVTFNDFFSLFLQSSIDNTIYNNLFNNDMGASILGYNSNRLNITKTADTNIIGSLYLGGNFWAKPDDTGFSQICPDENYDGICDSQYVLNANNIDYLPLAVPPVLPAIRFVNGTVMDSINKTGIFGVMVSINTTLSTTTNATGFYSFAVAEGTYNLKATFDITYYTNITTVSTIGKAVVVQDIELVKKPTGTITGSVTS